MDIVYARRHYNLQPFFYLFFIKRSNSFSIRDCLENEIRKTHKLPLNSIRGPKNGQCEWYSTLIQTSVPSYASSIAPAKTLQSIHYLNHQTFQNRYQQTFQVRAFLSLHL